MRRSMLIGAFLLIGCLLSANVSSATQPAIQIGTTQIVATGITPGGKAGWLGVARERDGWISRVMQWQRADSVADAGGRVVLDLGRQAPVKSIWVVVDFATGAFAASSPSTYPWATHAPFPTAGAVWASDGVRLLSLRVNRQELEVLVVRPTAGAWRATIRHNDPGSRAGAGVLLSPAPLVPWGGAPAFAGNLGPGDVIVAIDPDRMEYFAQQLGGHQ